MPQVLLFDVNETLVDLAALDDPFEEAFGDAGAREEWFNTVLHVALRITAADDYAPFGEIAAAALDALVERRAQSVTEAQREAILGGLRRLPAHPDAAPAFRRLQEAGVRLAALTNSELEAGQEKLDSAGLMPLLDDVFSAAEAGQLKPGPAPYQMAAQRLGVEVGDILFVAAHDWDVAGARQAGCRTAFVARPGKQLGPLVARPDVTVPTLDALAGHVLSEGEDPSGGAA